MESACGHAEASAMTEQSRSETAAGAFHPGGFPLRACLRATGELALARIQHRIMPVARINARNAAAGRHGRGPNLASARDQALVDLVGWVVPRVAHRLPWRADCLPQAMAAQRWLLASGIATSIVIGVERPDGTGFNSHAWLLYGERVVTGGDVAHLAPILGGHAAAADPS